MQVDGDGRGREKSLADSLQAFICANLKPKQMRKFRKLQCFEKSDLHRHPLRQREPNSLQWKLTLVNGRNKPETMYPEEEVSGCVVNSVRRSRRPLLRNCGARCCRRAVSRFDLLGEGTAQQPNIGGQDEFVEAELNHFRHLVCCNRMHGGG